MINVTIWSEYIREQSRPQATYHNQAIQCVIANAVRWTAPAKREKMFYGHHDPLEQMRK